MGGKNWDFWCEVAIPDPFSTIHNKHQREVRSIRSCLSFCDVYDIQTKRSVYSHQCEIALPIEVRIQFELKLEALMFKARFFQLEPWKLPSLED